MNARVCQHAEGPELHGVSLTSHHVCDGCPVGSCTLLYGVSCSKTVPWSRVRTSRLRSDSTLLAMSNWFITLHLLGAVQGVFLAAILASKRRASVATRILALVMLVFALDLAMGVYHGLHYDAVFPHLIGVDYSTTLLYGPLLYLYTRALTNRNHALRKTDLWHLLPFTLLMVALLPFYAQSGVEKLAFLQADVSNVWTQTLGVFNHVKLLHALIYIGVILVLLRRHRHRIKDTFSFTERIDLSWLRNLMVGIVLLTILSVVVYLFRLQEQAPVMGLDPNTTYDNYTLLGMALFIYAVGFMGLRQPEVFARRRPNVSSPSASPEEDTAPPPGLSRSPSRTETETAQTKPRYTRSGLTPATARLYKQNLVHLMDAEQPYRRTNLTLQDLSEALAISPHNLTEVINTQFGQNFYDFVNGYRVRDVQDKLADPTQAHLTMLALGLDAGFNSKSSFNAVFKKHTQMTPSQYRKHIMET